MIMDPKLLLSFMQGAEEIGVPLGDLEKALFSSYYGDILIWNGKMNLISAKDDAEIALKHFLDALTPVPFLPRGPLKILDIGTGPGLPGIPMKIAVEEWHLYLLEASRKRTSFLKETIRRLALQNTVVIHDRIENVIGQGRYRETFDVVVSRATFKLPQLIESANHFLIRGGLLVAMKGDIPPEEWVESLQVCDNTGISLNIEHNIVLPFTNRPRKIVIYKKTN
ncbi:MAG: Ribosomal RNA small subunit methyltransferase G [Syntrophus sp. SKADARSKE-3]|nr:Ribosomal RNA small subunit methyltransferase G [Syntrophus sp. SKADARSKE-3]